LAPAFIRRLVPVRVIGTDGDVLLARPESEALKGRIALPIFA
jgi:hypothetical protein